MFDGKPEFAPENVAVRRQLDSERSVALRPERPLQRGAHLVQVGGVTVKPASPGVVSHSLLACPSVDR
jgi:hypothetical protein